MKFKIKDIRPNPFRHLDRYPIIRAKVETLRESLRKTGFWGNINARKRDDGKAEIAYGHHRLVALQEEWGDERAVDLIMKPLTDEQMIQMMARENMEEWGADFTIHLESMRAIVEAYAAGSIDLPAPPERAHPDRIRHAPSFISGHGSQGTHVMPYTATSIGKFLGWLQPDGKASKNVRLAVRALELIELGFLTDKDFAGLSGKGAEAVMAQTLASFRAHQPAAPKGAPTQALVPQAATAEAKKVSSNVGHEVAEALKTGQITLSDAPKVRRKVEPKREKPPPMIETAANRTANRIAQMLFSDKQKENLSDLLDHKKHLPEKSRQSLVKALHDLAARALKLAEKFA